MKTRKHIISRFKQFKRMGKAVLETKKSQKEKLFDVYFDGNVILRMNKEELKAVDLKVPNE